MEGRQLFGFALAVVAALATPTSTVHPPATTTPNNGPFNCTFDSNMCGWVQDKSDQFDWTRFHGSTGTWGTGPTGDHTQANHGGYYVYIETTGRHNGDKARLISPNVRSGQYCLTFWYFMYGQDVDHLNVYIKAGSSLPSSPLWTRQRDQGHQWHQANVDVPTVSSTFNIVFEGLKGVSYKGDIALDDISLTSGSCALGPITASGVPNITSCDFETPNICGFTQQTSGDQFDWTRHSGTTLSTHTGPSNDHTYGTASGHYMYAEASLPRHSGDKAVLTSFAIAGTSQQICVNFWYHMRGSDIGVLNAYVRVNGQNQQRIWTLRGNQGSNWQLASVSVPAVRQQWQVAFEAIRGNGIQGDIAIDDFFISSVGCGANFSGNCNFDSGLCTWTQDHSGDFDWISGTGSTNSSKTGPDGDHTSTNGTYMYIETSAPRQLNDRAFLASEMLPAGSASCFHFWYNMYGINIYILRVWIRQNSNGMQVPLFQLKGQQTSSPQWLKGQVPIPKQTDSFSIVFEGVRGVFNLGDIAIDDVSFDNASPCTLTPFNANPTAQEVSFRPLSPTSPLIPTATTPTTTIPTVIPSTAAPTSTVHPLVTTTPNTGPFNCTFDSNMCGWVQDKSDQFDWTRFHGSTGTWGTGPTGDHTQANHGGYYVYIETTGRHNGDKARLISPNVGSGQYCLTFWYFMYGQDVDHLNVYIKAGSSLPSSPLWTRQRDQGHQWHQANVDVPTVSSTFNVVFEGLKGVSYKGDIALDDISLTSGSCALGPITASGVPNITSCDFETPNICGFTQQTSGDQFDWTRHSGTTLSTHTGPSNDHTYGTASGHYMYAEASLPRHSGDKAVLTSFAIAGTSQQICVNFWYHMRGSDIGVLNAYVRVSGQNQQRIWTLRGNQGSNWQLASVSVPAVRQQWQVAFEAIRGNGIQGDIAVDDFSISSVGCGANFSGNCNFDSGLCTWTQDHSGDFDWISGTGSTNSSETGPSGDHTSTNGTYMYIEASAPRQLNDRAFLASEMLPAGSASCFHFWYNMYGINIYILRVWIRQNSNGMQVPLFQLKGQQTSSPQWLKGQVPIPKQNDSFSIVFEGVRGVFNLGDIAIDDVSFDNASPCPLTPFNANPTAQEVSFRPLSPTSPLIPTATTPTTTIPTVIPSTAAPTSTVHPLVTTTPNTGPFNCTFDSNMCGWVQDKSDQFDWTRFHGSTGTWGTGPTGDHTQANHGGYYVYIETTGRHNGDKARLISPNVGSGQYCLTFWYFMYGQDVDHLNVYIKAGSSLPSSPLWTRQRDQGHQWHQANVDVPTVSSTFNIVFEGLKGVRYKGDIALDDISLTSGSCALGPITASGVPNITSCDFETPNICGFTQQTSGDQFNWTRHSGTTSSTHTGPNNDHTYGTASGHYMYAEASLPRHSGDKAVLTSFAIAGTSQQICVNFWYHMRGSDIGVLNAYVRVSGQNQQRIWTLRGNQGSNWQLASVSVPAVRQQWQVAFEAIRGNGIQGDIAIDDFSISSVGCGANFSGNCDFDNGLCTWTQDHSGDFDWISGTGSTNSSKTGPSGDHTSTNGTYMYIEASAPRQLNDRAFLASEMLPAGSASCFHFWYNMYGANIYILRVWIQQNSNGMQLPLFQLKGQQTFSPQWLKGQVPIPKQNDSFSIVFEGVRGTFTLGDIAIDDVSFDNATSCPLMPSNASPSVHAVTFCPLPPTSPLTPTTTTATTTIPTAPASTVHPPVTTTPNTGPFNCTFDSNMCGWVQDKSDQFDWTRFHGSTGTWGTGPPGDHTQANHGGYYVYIETGGRHNGDKARLISPNVGSGQYCLTFWYFMYGQDVDHLNVYIKAGSSLSSSPLWTRQRDQGHQWHQTNVDVPTVSSTFNIVFEGLRGVSYRGDIALDDISLTSGSCALGPTTASGVPNITSCDFETPNICGFTQQTSGDQFHWTRHSGTPLSAHTGPSNDHTYGTSSGHYMYAEASAPRHSGDKAVLTSFPIAGTSQATCVNFWYHMSGSDIGTLNAYVKVNGQNQQRIWTLRGNQGSNWQLASVSVPAVRQQWQVAFEAIRGNGIQGDIAIDDFSISSFGCGANFSGNCNFDNGLCTWTQDRSGDFDWISGKGSTNSSQTGPSGDHTSNNGKYMYIEASAPRQLNDRAFLESEMLPAGSASCFHFWYNMYGVNINILRVWIRQNSNGMQVPLFQLKGQQTSSPQWLKGQVPIPKQTDSFSIVFEGVRGTFVWGDIAIDDVSFDSASSCPLTPSNANPTVQAVTFRPLPPTSPLSPTTTTATTTIPTVSCSGPCSTIAPKPSTRARTTIASKPSTQANTTIAPKPSTQAITGSGNQDNKKWAVPVGVVLGVLVIAAVAVTLFVLYRKNKLSGVNIRSPFGGSSRRRSSMGLANPIYDYGSAATDYCDDQPPSFESTDNSGNNTSNFGSDTTRSIDNPLFTEA